MVNFAIFLGNILNRFLGNYESDFDKVSNSGTTPENSEWMKMLKIIVKIVDQFMPVVMIGVGLVGAIYIIIISVKYAKAENEDEKNETKKKLINTVIGVVIGLLIMIVLSVWLKNSKEIADYLNGFGGK